MSTLVNSSSNTAKPSTENLRRPAFRVRENEREARIRVYLPGVTKEAINLNFEQGVLSLKAAGADSLPEGWKVLHRERPAASFGIAFAVDEQFDADQVSAEFTNGVLSITLPRAEQALPREISVA